MERAIMKKILAFRVTVCYNPNAQDKCGRNLSAMYSFKSKFRFF